MNMMQPVSESKFFMWRTLFAMAHADDVVTDEELRFMTEALEDVPFSEAQKQILQKDISEPQDIVEMFGKIEDPRDQAAFFKFARDIVWIDGDYGTEEQEIMLKLKQEHIKHVNVDTLVGGLEMELESDHEMEDRVADSPGPQRSWRSKIFSFRKSFVDNL